MTNNDIVSAFIAEWSTPQPDVAHLASYFTDDAVYHNMPTAPVTGRAAIQQTFAGIISQVEPRGWEVLSQVSSGNIEINERIDRFVKGDKSVELPVAGVFELRDGKIAAWRDYFDMATWRKALA
ncbi:MAG: limonene-1,2-epoxide hydrolase [Chloroflexi bacterium]|nr:limonene-1,2-epoxide hydrolase [Chloroflexota bacterium]